jgi:hypothetical protein
MIAGEAPGAEAAVTGALRKVPTKPKASAAGSPALRAALATYFGSAPVSLFVKILV